MLFENSSVSLFKKIVDAASNSVCHLYGDFKAIYDHFQFDSSGGYSLSDAQEKISERIREQLKPGETELAVDNHEFLKIEDALVYDSILHDVDNTLYLLVHEVVRNRLSNFKPLTEKRVWITVASLARDYISIAGKKFYREIDEEFPKSYDVASAFKILRDTFQCELEWDGSHLSCKTGLEKAVEHLERLINDVGGITLMNRAFDFVVKNHYYLYPYKLYAFGNRFNASKRTLPLIPIGYLLNLSVKFPHDGQQMSDQDLHYKLTEIQQLATTLSTSLRVQPYSMMEMQFLAYKPLQDVIRNLALYDSVFSINSANVSHTLDFMSFAFKWVDPASFSSAFGFSIDDYLDVANAVSNITKSKNGTVTVYMTEVKRRCLRDLKKKTVSVILDHMAHKKSANDDYKQVADFDKYTFGFKPLIALSETKYLLCDIAWCAPAFYECLAALVRTVFDTPKKTITDRKIGDLLELYIQKKLSERNITFHTGNYTDGQKPKGECDLLIESPTHITIIEVKKKSLSRNSRSGKDTNLVLDLTNSLLNSQIQSGRTELLLRKQGYIDLTDKSGKTSRIYLDDRLINRLSLSHLDFGSFQDRTVINAILTSLVDTRINLLSQDDEELITKFKEVQKKCNVWTNQAVELQKLSPAFDHYPFFDCWFLSLQQFLLVLDLANDNITFTAAFNTTKHVTMASGNFYFEFFYSSGHLRKTVEM